MGKMVRTCNDLHFDIKKYEKSAQMRRAGSPRDDAKNELREEMERRAILVMRDPKVSRVCKDNRASVVTMVMKVRKATLETKATQVQQVSPLMTLQSTTVSLELNRSGWIV